jgi:predicted enzyme related to lactoylglutathione lyase
MKKLLLLLAFGASFGAGYALSRLHGNAEAPRRRVTGIGGIFFKAKDPKKLKEWYNTHLGLNTDAYGTVFEWRQATDSTKKGVTQWSPFKETTTYFAPSTKDFMINYRVVHMDALVTELKAEGVNVLDTILRYDYGSFVHIMDLEGNKIELWEPNDAFDDGNTANRTK